MPGLGQFLNGKYVKALTLVFLEFIINVQSRLNLSIIYSFQGKMSQAIEVTNYQWLMFYPCIYLFAIWDGYHDALKLSQREPRPFLSVPFVMSAFITTIGVIYSNIGVLGHIFGPVFMPILAMIIGYGVGVLVKKWLLVRIG